MPETPMEAVVEFGPDDDAAREPRRFNPGGFLTGLAADRRLVPIAAVLGAVALFGSFVSEWQITEVDRSVFGDGEVGTRPLETSLADLGSWGGGYLAALFLLVPLVVLTLFGPFAGRRYTRLGALSVGGVLLAMLAATGSELGDVSRIIGQPGLSGLDADQVTISYGRGLWCAVAGTVLVVLAMYLAGRDTDVPPPLSDDDEPAPEPPPIWSWRRPEAAEEGPPDAPFDLTVTSTKPFTASQDNRDKPSEGISG
ncbi:hypothetical protein [Actinoplanes friuliensis]|uniref:Uncharacterized protein n=1 Tax=Actinoplanes friuliensis DSM 7358 TaxID=1246995 RepID=U5WFR4_9ACTN|nr:hypothetical protein [Actinoplanes friuliensis]AGZ46771.1 hypothetical protein AFR_42585 [Actinoplanes friuliensis DSM 7358]